MILSWEVILVEPSKFKRVVRTVGHKHSRKDQAAERHSTGVGASRSAAMNLASLHWIHLWSLRCQRHRNFRPVNPTAAVRNRGALVQQKTRHAEDESPFVGYAGETGNRMTSAASHDGLHIRPQVCEK